jgi:hypothetical protein
MHAWPGSAPQVSAGIRHLGLFPTSVGFYPHEERGKGGAQWMGHCQRGIHGSGHAFSAWVAAGAKHRQWGCLVVLQDLLRALLPRLLGCTRRKYTERPASVAWMSYVC